MLERGEARLGKVTIPADQKSFDRKPAFPEGDVTGAPASQIEDYYVEPAPKGSQKKIEYTIDNRMEYRDIAKDLQPDSTGKYRKEKEGRTARPDWYTRYLQGGGLAQTLALATDRVSKDPKIKNYKGDLNR